MRIDSLDVMKSQQLLSSKYQKYTWICPSDCDALIEYTFKDGYGQMIKIHAIAKYGGLNWLGTLEIIK